MPSTYAEAMVPAFEDVERKELKNSPLELVVCQLRFPSVLSLVGGHPPQELQMALADEYPVARPKQNKNIEVGPSGVNETITVIWTFEDAESNWTVSLAPTFLALEVKDYKRFKDFKDRFSALSKLCIDLYGIKLQERLGLRYVDQLSQSLQPFLPDDWVNKLRPELLALRNCVTDGETINSSAEHRFHKEGHILALRTLFTQAGFPGAVEDRLVLDIDCYAERRASLDGLEEMLDSFKKSSYAAFRWAIHELIDFFEEAE